MGEDKYYKGSVMLKVLRKIPLFILMRKFRWPGMLPLNLTISLSPRCNSRCLTCNIWKKKEDDLTLPEWVQIFKSLGRAPYWITISGGEPFLQNIVPITGSLYEHCKPAIINIPTNGLLTEIISKKVSQICEGCPDSQVIINISLDGVGEKHDRIRGVPGNFSKTLATYNALRELKYKNLTIGFHSVISIYNVDDIEELYDFVIGLKPDSYITEIAEQRVELDTLKLPITPSSEKYTQAIDRLIAQIETMKFQGISKITVAFRVLYYNLVKKWLCEKKQIIPCYAGWASAQIYADGQVWPCCVRADKIMNLRDVDYDFKRVWFSDEANVIRKSIYNKECHCPLANASYTNMLMHWPTLVRVLNRILTR